MSNIRELNNNEWVNLVNRESHPDIDYCFVEHVKLGDAYAVSIYSGVGSFLSGLTKNKKDLVKMEKELKKKYQDVKNSTMGTSLRAPGQASRAEDLLPF